MKKFLILILEIFMFCSLLSYSEEAYSPGSKEFMNAVKTLILSESKNNKKLKEYIQKGVQEKNLLFSVKIEKEKIIVIDKNNKLLYEKILSKDISNKFLPFEMKYQEIQKKQGFFEYGDITYLENNKKFRIKLESKIKKSSQNTKKSQLSEVYSTDIEYEKAELYDKNGKLLTKQEDIGNKTIVTNYLDKGYELKIIYNFDSNLTTGNIETWLDKILISKGKMKDGLPHGETKVFNEKGKVASIVNFKNGVQDGITKNFDENGKLIKETLYKNEVEVKK